jgi:hypothetical protein
MNGWEGRGAFGDERVIEGLSRRSFFKLTAGGALALYTLGARGVREVAAAPIPGGTLAPGTIPKFVTPLVIPPAMPNGGAAHEYSIAVKQFSQQILPPPCRRRQCGATAPRTASPP